MTPLHLAVGSNRIRMVKCLFDQGANINLQDDNEVILHTNAVDYFELAGMQVLYPLFIFSEPILCCLNIRFSVFKLQS